MPTVLGVDSSTQACKVEVRDADSGELLASGRAPHPPVHPPRSEQAPDAWWDALVDAVRDAGAKQIDAMAVAAQQHGLVALDEHTVAVRPAKLWNDTESASDARWLWEQLGGPEAWAEACGSVPLAAFTITKLCWLRRTEPSAWDRLHRVCLPHDYLNHRLTGRFVTDRGDASGTGYWSARTGAYRPDLLAIVDGEKDWERAVPSVLGPREPAGRASASATAALGFERAPLVAAGTGDNMAAALGMGLRSGDVALSFGTSGTVFAVTDAPTADPTGAVAGFADATGRYLPLVCTLNATLVTDAVARLLGVDRDQLSALALESNGSTGVVLVPYFAGERTPNRPNARGTLSGLHPDVTRSAVARAAFEGVVCGMLDGLDALQQATALADSGRMLLVGGGSRVPAYVQLTADLAQRDVTLPAGDEHVALGACVQAASMLRETHASAVMDEWQLGPATLVAPRHDTDHEAIRAAYAAARR